MPDNRKTNVAPLESQAPPRTIYHRLYNRGIRFVLSGSLPYRRAEPPSKRFPKGRPERHETPERERGKIPLRSDWLEGPRPTAEEALEHIRKRGYRGDNRLGFVPGSLELLVVDHDDPEFISERELMEAVGPPLLKVPSRHGDEGRGHHYYRGPLDENGNPEKIPNWKWRGGELRGSNGHIVAWGGEKLWGAISDMFSDDKPTEERWENTPPPIRVDLIPGIGSKYGKQCPGKRRAKVTLTGSLPPPTTDALFAEYVEVAPQLARAFEHDISTFRNKTDTSDSGWDWQLCVIAEGLTDDEILALMIRHNLHWETGKAADEHYLRFTLSKLRAGREDNAEEDDADTAEPVAAESREEHTASTILASDSDLGTELDPAAPSTNGATPHGDAPPPPTPRQKLIASLLKENHAATLFGAAERLMVLHADKLLIANYRDRGGVSQGQIYLLTQHGLWMGSEPQLRALLVNTDRECMKAAVAADLDKNGELTPETKALLGTHKSVLNARTKTALEHAPSVPATWNLSRFAQRQALTFADRSDLDTKPGYFGMPNGVYSLADKTILPASEGRKHLITMSTPVAYDPDATHPAVDQITAHLDPEIANFLWASLGRALWGGQTRSPSSSGRPTPASPHFSPPSMPP